MEPKPLIPRACSPVSASTSSSRSPSNIKIEQVLNCPSSAPTDPFLQSSTTAAASTLHLSLPPPTPTSLLPLTTTLHISDPPAAPTQLPEYRHNSHPLPSSASPEQSMAAAVVVPQSTHAMQPFTRPIRFVANDGQPHPKRRRIGAACMTCRKRKTRCSGEKPICDTCRQNGHACLGYSDPTPSTLSHIPQQQKQQRQQSNHQASSKIAPTPVTTPTEKLTLKDSLFGTHTSPQDRRSPQERDSSTSQQCELPNHCPESLSTSTPSRRKSQKRKSTDCQGKDEKGNDWDMDSSRIGSVGGLTDEGSSPALRYQTPPATQRLAHRIPYFRYFGPTAIVPGYKQMVVEVKDLSNRLRHKSHPMSANTSGTSPTSKLTSLVNPTLIPIIASSTVEEIPFYDPSDGAPNNPLIGHLIEIFFIHLGCNFPFLRWETFTRDVMEKQVDVILVDAVCAVAARFSDHPLLQTTSAQAEGLKVPQYSRMCEYGTAFANRAKSQVVDTFACPSLSTVQACILLAYVEFGSNRDSGLWMFLGIAIRMAQDLGLHKSEEMRGDSKGRKEGMRIRSRSTSNGNGERGREGYGNRMGREFQEMNDREAEMQEQERTDTFWAVFFLDRVISSGTGRPVTISTTEVGITFPKEETNSEYPPPFPALVKIVHLYGRITDLLNSINDMRTIAIDTFSRLSDMEAELTEIYQRLSPNLHFNVPNFRQYSSTNQGSVFLLLHIWFHTLIVLLHRPTLLIAFEGRVQELFPNSRELSMSSAKTISDILCFAELIDPRAVNGNPFTSQPIYIAACAFLQEGLTHSFSNPTSRSSSPSSGAPQTPNAHTFCNIESISPRSVCRLPTVDLGSPKSSSGVAGIGDIVSLDSKHKINADDCSKTQKKHALLAQAAQANYQRCYKALKGLETYWEGVRYILTVLDQKAKGIVDPLLYTVEEMESAEVHWRPDVWSRIHGDTGDTEHPVKREGGFQPAVAPSSGIFSSNRIPEQVPSPLGSSIHGDSHQAAIGLSATGTTNSPNLNITWLFANNEHNNIPQNQFPTTTPHEVLPLHDPRGGMQPPPHDGYDQHGAPTPTTSPASKYSLGGSTPSSDAEMLLGLSGAGQKIGFGQQNHEQHGHGMDGIVMGNSYSDGNFQAGGAPGGFGYGIMSESVNMNNLSWNLHCLEYMPAYWDSNFPAADEVG